MKKSFLLLTRQVLYLLFIPVLMLFLTVCEGGTASSSPGQDDTVTPAVTVIQSQEQFNKILEKQNQLMVFDLYADWCGPCKVLSPMLEEIARENKDKAAFYKIDVDQLPRVAAAFKVSGIPYVVFFKNKTVIHSLTGLYPKDAYVKAIRRLSLNRNTGK